MIDASKVIELRDYPPGTRIYLRVEPLHSGGEGKLVRYRREPGDRVPDEQPAVRSGVSGRAAPDSGPLRESDQVAEVCRVGETAVRRVRSEPGAANLAMFTVNLVAWVQLAALPAGHDAGRWDLKRWHYRVWSLAGKLITSSRQARIAE